jgi:ABC-2 type transport system ATP-binding protein
MTGRRNLEFFAALYGASGPRTAERIGDLVRLLDMGEFIDRRFDRYSSGMKQRLGIARGLLNQPPLVFLDEPTKSLDPGAAARLRETIHKLVHREGHTIVLVTHQLPEAEDLCDRIAIMHQGQIRVVDDTAGLRKMVRSERRYQFEVINLSPRALSRLEALEGVLGLKTQPLEEDRITVKIRLLEDPDKLHLANVIETLVGRGAQIVEVRSEELSLDEVFKEYTEGP